MYDEFWFIKSAIYQTTLPLLTNGAAFLICSSQAVSADEDITNMLHAKLPDGTDVMKRLNWNRACTECLANGLANTCKHVLQQPQHFQQRKDQARLKALLSAFGDDAHDREVLNIGARSLIEPAFDPLWFAPLRDRSYDYAPAGSLAAVRDHRAFFVVVDPAGSGFSRNVMVSLLFDRVDVGSSFVPYQAVVCLSLLL